MDPVSESEELASASASTSVAQTETQAQAGMLPALPAPLAEGEASGDANNDTTVIEVNGAAVMLDKLGPMVVGRDGMLSRIANWGEMTKIERDNTLRILCKRNQLRLANLRGNDNDEKQT